MRSASGRSWREALVGRSAVAFTRVPPGSVAQAEALAQPTAGNAQQKTLSSEVVRRQYTGMLSTARQILKEEGWWAFTSGLRVRVLTNAPAVAISWTTYELFKSALNGALDFSI